jgi:glycosyltransferase involved in cell wall biosynthesis
VSWVGRVDPLKDLETLILSFTEVRRTVPNAQLRLFGPVPHGNEAYHARLQALITQHDLGAQVHFEGPISPVYKAYHAADVVVLSSISEGFPYTPIEAMMCSKPVVATRVGGVAEAIGTFGRLVEPRDSLGLGRALSELLLDVPLRQRLGAAARERALERFTLYEMNGAYDKLYRELIELPPPSPDVPDVRWAA